MTASPDYTAYTVALSIYEGLAARLATAEASLSSLVATTAALWVASRAADASFAATGSGNTATPLAAAQASDVALANAERLIAPLRQQTAAALLVAQTAQATAWRPVYIDGITQRIAAAVANDAAIAAQAAAVAATQAANAQIMQAEAQGCMSPIPGGNTFALSTTVRTAAAEQAVWAQLEWGSV